MLLSDWVFTQQPYTIRRLLNHLTSQPSLKILMATISHDRSSTTLLPPERCGRDDLLRAAEGWLTTGVQRDVCVALAIAVREGLSAEEIHRFCMTLGPKPGQEDLWFLFARLAGAFASINYAEARDLFERYDKNFIWNLQLAERYDLLEAHQQMFEAAVRVVVVAGASTPIGQHSPESSSILAGLATSLDLAVYTTVFEHDLSDRTVLDQAYRLFLGSSSSRNRSAALERFAFHDLGFETLAFDACSRFLGEVDNALDQSVGEWKSSLKPWSTIVETGIKVWGLTPTFIDIALVAAGVTGKEERGNFGAHFHDASTPLCERFRFARLKSGAPNWWISQLELSNDNGGLEIPLTVLLCWGTTRTILQICHNIERVIDSFDDSQWSRLLQRIQRAARVGAASSATLEGVGSITSDRLFLAVALRTTRNESDNLVFERFREYSGKDAQILEAVSNSAIRLALANPRNWAKAVSVIRQAYLNDILTDVQPSFDPEISESTATAICEAANDFPLSLVYLAQSALQPILAKKIIRPVGELALRDSWFTPGYAT